MPPSDSPRPTRRRATWPASASRPVPPARWGRLVGLVLGLMIIAGCSQPPVTHPGAEPGTAAPLRVLIFGDSFTEGVGADPITRGYAYLLSERLGWQVTVDGVGGTGYVAPGPNDRGPYLRRLADAPPGPFDLVVVQGSTNDERQPLTALGPAVAETVPAFGKKYPGARVVMLGPIALSGSASVVEIEVRDILRAYAVEHGVDFIDPIAESWFTEGERRIMANPENGHPSNTGYLRIRDRLIIDLARLPATTGPG